MDQKHTMSKEELWSDHNLQTSQKPAVADLRPTKNAEPIVIENERPLSSPETSVNLMLKSYSTQFLEASQKSNTKPLKQSKELRYIKHNKRTLHKLTLNIYDTPPLPIPRPTLASARNVRIYAILISLIKIDSALLRFSIHDDLFTTGTRLADVDCGQANRKNNENTSVACSISQGSSSSEELIIEELEDCKLKQLNDSRFEKKQIPYKLPPNMTRFLIAKIDKCGKRSATITYCVKQKYRLKVTTVRGNIIRCLPTPSDTEFKNMPIRLRSLMCRTCWKTLESFWVSNTSIGYLLNSIQTFRKYSESRCSLALPSDCNELPLCEDERVYGMCKKCMKVITKAWVYGKRVSKQQSLSCLYTLVKMCVINGIHVDGDRLRLSQSPSEKRQFRRNSFTSRYAAPIARVFLPKFERTININNTCGYTTRNYQNYLTQWKDALNGITLCARFLNYNGLTEDMIPLKRPTNSCSEQFWSKSAADAIIDGWLSGGTFGSRNAVLVFRSSELAQSSELSINCKPSSKLHITFRVVQAETKLLAKLLECHGITEASIDSNNYNLLWTGSHPKPGVLRSMAPHQRVNHFPRSYELTRKDRLYKNIEKMQHAKGFKHFDFIPQTFLMPTEYRELCSTHHRVKGPWIIKPAASSRGRGIYIVESPNQVPIEEPVVVAKYISKPLLIKGHKCDLRLYVAVTSFDPLLIYIYEEGMVRFATVKYDTTHKQLWNPCMHLCNYSINKYHSDYVKSDDPSAENVGHKWTLSALLRHLKSNGKDTAQLMTQIEDLVIKAILSCANSIITACKMFVPHPYNCFELYGFDILIDENLKPWLLEVNLSPSLGCDSPLDVRLKSAMLADLLTLIGIPAVDPVIKPPSPANSSTKSLRAKASNCRRINSADGLSNHTLPKKNSRGSVTASNSTLSNEDTKMIKNARSQFVRRGGFVRIFPAVDSWTKYAQYLDPVCGIPIAGSTTSIPFSFLGQHNNNQILYKSLYPEMVVTPTVTRIADKYKTSDRPRDGSLDSVRRCEGPVSTPRQDRYERKLSQGHRASLVAPKKPLQENGSAELKKQVCDMVKNGKKLTQVEARRAFSQYLVCVLKRISTSSDQDGHIDIVLKFLQKASSYLKNPFFVRIPSQKLSEKDRAAIVAKQLNDFLYLYNRETDLYADLDRPGKLPKNVFNDFLEHSSESDLEEVLILQNIHTVPNKGSATANSMTGASTFQGLLRCLPSINSICFSSPEVVKKPVKVTPLS